LSQAVYHIYYPLATGVAIVSEEACEKPIRLENFRMWTDVAFGFLAKEANRALGVVAGGEGQFLV
jgi:hypothetical protein